MNSCPIWIEYKGGVSVRIESHSAIDAAHMIKYNMVAEVLV